MAVAAASSLPVSDSSGSSPPLVLVAPASRWPLEVAAVVILVHVVVIVIVVVVVVGLAVALLEAVRKRKRQVH